MRSYRLLRPLLFTLPPETAHRAALATMRAMAHRPSPVDEGELAVEAFGLHFANPVGLAAGFDKNAEAIEGAQALGFGFTEVGTVTPKPQPGNPRPRLFRLSADRALINRMGFNNAGHEAVHARLAAAKTAGCGPVGVNLGANRDNEDPTSDYVTGVHRFSDIADYLAINVSSPNTPGLRDLQSGAALENLLARVMEARAGQSRRVPILLKIAPELAESGQYALADLARRYSLDGLIVSNTTTERPASLPARRRSEAGGLSGAPLMGPSTALLAEMHRLTDGKLPLIGVGGVMSGADAVEKRRAGASLVQLYTGLVYEGPGLVARCKAALAVGLPASG